MSRIILPPALDFVFILIKSPLQLKLMTGVHPGTMAPLVIYSIPWTFLSTETLFFQSSVLSAEIEAMKFLEGDLIKPPCSHTPRLA